MNKPLGAFGGSSPASSKSVRPPNLRATWRGIRTPRGNPISKIFLYRMLNNRACIGEVVHKGTG
jgi:hypothetical protein